MRPGSRRRRAAAERLIDEHAIDIDNGNFRAGLVSCSAVHTHGHDRTLLGPRGDAGRHAPLIGEVNETSLCVLICMALHPMQPSKIRER